MRATFRRFLVVAVAVSVSLAGAGVARADVECADCANSQEGDNEGSAAQGGASNSGDAVGGQVTGIVSSGDASVDAKNRSEKADIVTGAASGANTASSFVGLSVADGDVSVVAEDVTAGTVTNVQEGDNEADIAQAADASSGDGVGGQVIGAVTSAGGSADIVADNASKKVDIDTGDASADNSSAAYVGLTDPGDFLRVHVGAFDISFDASDNVQEGDNSLSSDQTAGSSSGDGVGGQVLGVVSAGDASVDARNRTEKVDVETGLSDAGNDSAVVVGLTAADGVVVDTVAADITGGEAFNVQDGDNDASIAQSADASSGDGVAGQVAGVVTSAGGSADLVLDNASKKVDVETGDADADNDAASFVGLHTTLGLFLVGVDDISGVDAANIQEGDNELTEDQTATAASGDGVAGQVTGVVSAGDASVDAKNRSEKVDIETGLADADNTSSAFVGLGVPDGDAIIVALDIEDVEAENIQEGDNSADLSQSSDAASGDGVGGQVIGAVTSAGGSADIVADNASKKVDIETGEAEASNFISTMVGLNEGGGALFVGGDDISVSGEATNVQEGDNALSADQAADASTGDGVGGQVLGVVSAGDASVDAKNRSEKIDLETGDATAFNEAAAVVGLNESDLTGIFAADVSVGLATNVQDGDNDASLSQTAEASSGDAVGGQVTGVVTSAGGSADAVLDNASKKIDAETGPSEFANSDLLFVGLNFNDDELFIGPD